MGILPGIAVWRVVIKPKSMPCFGPCQFSPKKNVCLPTQLGACSHPTGRSTVPIGPRLMFGPLGHATASARAVWASDGRPAARWRLRPADFHRRPPVWAARHSYRRRPGLSYQILKITDSSISLQVNCLDFRRAYIFSLAERSLDRGTVARMICTHRIIAIASRLQRLMPC